MKINLSVLIGCVVCIVLAVGVGVLNRAEENGDAWRPSSVYSHVGSSSSSVVSSGSSASSGVAVPVRGGRSMISSSRRVSSPVSSYAPAHYVPSSPANGQYPIGGTSSYGQSPIANRQGLYTTSSATAKSFGSGNAASAVSMSGGSVRATSSQSSITNRQSPIADIQSSITNIQSPIANVQLPTMPKYQGIGNTTTNGPRAMRGRLSAPTLGDPWWNWLSDWVGETGYAGTGKEEGGYDYYFDRYDLQGAYEDFVNNYWNSSLGNPPSFNEWLDWFMSSTGNDGYQMGDDTYHWLPIGDVWPLVVMLLFYAGYVFVRKRKQLKVNA